MTITKKQKLVYDYITSYIENNGYAPTQKEIKDHFEFKSFGSVQRYIKYLIDADMLQSSWNKRRGLQKTNNISTEISTDNNINVEEIPLLGNVAAGIPIDAIENPTELISIPSYMIRSGHKHYALKVKGDSMIEDGIFEDDIIVCRYIKTATQGQTVIAVIDEEATVKKYFKKNNSIELHPANSTMSPIVINNGNFRIAGVLVGLIRSYD